MGKFGNTWRLMKSSWGVLRKDRELMVFPLLSGAACLLVLASFLVPLLMTGAFEGGEEGTAGRGPVEFVLLFAFYFANYFVITFFNTALVACAAKRFSGGDPTVGYGLSEAFRRLPLIAGWALLAATVGMILRAIEERAGFLGRIVAAVLGFAWTIASFLVVPVLVIEGKGPLDAFKSSTALLRKTWGESLVFHFGFGMVGSLLALPGILLMAAAVIAGIALESLALAVVLGAAGVLWLILLSLATSAMQGIFQTALYLYARDGTAPEGFEESQLAGAIARK